MKEKAVVSRKNLTAALSNCIIFLLQKYADLPESYAAVPSPDLRSFKKYMKKTDEG